MNPKIKFNEPMDRMAEATLVSTQYDCRGHLADLLADWGQ